MIRMFSRYLSLLILIPALFLLGVALTFVYNSTQTFSDVTKLKTLVKLTDTSSALVNELQKERGMSAGFLGSQGKNFVTELKNQRQKTDSAIRVFKDLVGSQNADHLTEAINQEINEVYASLSKLPEVRGGVDRLSIDKKDMLGYFTDEINVLLSGPMLVAQTVNDKDATQKLLSGYMVAQVKEQGGIQRAVFSNVLGKKSLDAGDLSRIHSLMSAEKSYFSSAKKLALSEKLDKLKTFVNSSANKAVEAMRSNILSAAEKGEFNIAPEVWFAASTKRLQALRQLEITVSKTAVDYVDFLNTSARVQLTMGLVMSIFTLLLTFLLFKIVSVLKEQSKEISRVINTIESSNDLTHRFNVISDDHLGKSAATFNHFLDKISKDLGMVARISYNAVAATHDTVVAVVQSDDNINRQLSETTTTSSAVEELSASINGVSDAISDQVGSIRSTKDLTSQGNQVVGDAVRGINEVADEMVSLSSSINTLSGEVKNISDFIDVIQSVAEQTNLLALNAAIEAARAGEQGRGFAVVADEVRILAQRVQESAAQISGIISTLQRDSSEATEKIQRGQVVTNNTVNQIQSIETVFNDIISSVDRIEQMSAAINENARQQAEVTRSVAENVMFINRMSEENSIGTNEISQSAKQLSDISTDLIDLIDQYKFDDQERFIKPSEWKYGTT